MENENVNENVNENINVNINEKDREDFLCLIFYK